MKTTYLLPLLALLTLFTLSSCDDDDDGMELILDVPTNYAFSRDGASTVSFSGQTARIGMANELAAALTDDNRTANQLADLFTNPEGSDPYQDASLNASTKSVRSKVAASQDLFSANTVAQAAIRADFDEWISAQATEVFPAWNQVAAPGTPGQIADGTSTRYVNAWGLEYNQAIVKGLIGALMVDQMQNNYLSPAVLDAGTNRADNDAGIVADGQPYTTMEHKWDEAYGYLFGASADPTNGLADLGAADQYLNKYLSRVEGDADYAGIAAAIEEDFRVGRAAIVAGDYAERDARATAISENLRTVVAVRAIYYLKQGEANLQGNALGAAFHDLSEGYGFVYSLRFLNSDRPGLEADHTALSDSVLATLRNEGNDGFWNLDPDDLAAAAQSVADATGVDLAAAAE